MVNFVSTPPKILTNFLSKFQPLFSKPTFVSFSTYVSGLFLELKRTNIQTITERTSPSDYENLTRTSRKNLPRKHGNSETRKKNIIPDFSQPTEVGFKFCGSAIAQITV